MEPTYVLGLAIAKAVLKTWLKDRAVAAGLGLTLADIVAKAAASAKEQRKLRRTFEGVAEHVSGRLEPLLESEFRHLDDGDRVAAVLGVARVLDETPLGKSIVLATDLDPQKLERYVRRYSKTKRSALALSSAGDSFFSWLLAESCSDIVEIYASLDDFDSDITRELLARSSALSEHIGQVLESIPRSEIVASTADSEFETRYRRELAREHDHLDLFGLEVPRSYRRYKLSLAYVTLQAEVVQADGSSERDEVSVENLPVDVALAVRSRTLIRGEAGSGKSTLLQYLLVNGARDTYGTGLSGWSGKVPVLIQLRRYANGQFPPVATLMEFCAPMSAVDAPNGWMHRQLADGNVVVMIDGVDELPEREREPALRWLEGLLESYPTCNFVVTSRPPALNTNWVDLPEFQVLNLEPMETNAIETFVTQWHSAAQVSISGSLASELPSSIDEMADALKSTIRQSPPLQLLATNPLLCAMICALHMSRKTQLPSDRSELYRIALEMLLERRDEVRKMPHDDMGLSRREKEHILAQLAWWMMVNDHADVSMDRAIGRVEEIVSYMPGLVHSGSDVFAFLLARSGVLREPIVGRIDFVHRTFLEYLAAIEALRVDNLELLVRNAARAEWRETCLLAAGIAGSAQHAVLVGGFIKAGNRARKPDKKAHYYLLAVAGSSLSTHQPPSIAKDLAKVLSSVVPPQSMAEAEALAGAGDLAVPLLKYHRGLTSREAAGCVRTLSRIGSRTAVTQLVDFAGDTRKQVVDEIIRSGRYLGRDDFCSLLRHVDTSGILFGVRSIEEGRQVLAVTNGARLQIESARGPGLPEPGGVSASDWSRVSDAATSIDAKASSDAAAAALLSSRSALSVRLAVEVPSTPLEVGSGSQIRHLDVQALGGEIPSFRVASDALTSLRLRGAMELEIVAGLKLEYVHAVGLRRLTWRERHAESLKSLCLRGENPGDWDFAAREVLRELRHLELDCPVNQRSDGSLDLGWRYPNLREAELRFQTAETVRVGANTVRFRLTDSSTEVLDLSEAVRLRKLVLLDCPNICDVRLPTVKSYDLTRSQIIERERALAWLPPLDAAGSSMKDLHIETDRTAQIPNEGPTWTLAGGKLVIRQARPRSEAEAGRKWKDSRLDLERKRGEQLRGRLVRLPDVFFDDERIGSTSPKG